MRYPSELKVLSYPAPVLRRLASPVTDFGADLARFVDRMFTCMYDAKGIGLAAPQIGVSQRIFVTDHAQREGEGRSERRVFINPRISDCAGEQSYEEGCLSFPGIYAKVTRPDRFTLTWQDLHGVEQQQRFDISAGDFLGVVVQHELDHLDGKVFVDLLTPLQVNLIRRRLREMEKDWKAEHGNVGALLRR